MSRHLAILSLIMATLTASPAAARHRWDDGTPRWRDKYLSIGMGLTGVLFHPVKGSDIIGPPSRVSGTFSLQTGIWYILGDLRVSTDPAFDFGLGGFFRLGSIWRGWLVGSPLLFMRVGEHRVRIAGTNDWRRDPITAYGIGARLEYLLFRSTLGFFIEARQTFHDPLDTTITFGVSWSPLMFLDLRESWD